MAVWSMRFESMARVKLVLAVVLFAMVFACALSLTLLAAPSEAQTTTISFGKSGLTGTDKDPDNPQNSLLNLVNPTSLQFGPDGRLYVAQQNGLIKAYTVERNAANNYSVSATETISAIQSIP